MFQLIEEANSTLLFATNITTPETTTTTTTTTTTITRDNNQEIENNIQQILLVGLLISLILISIVGNCLVCVAIFTDRRLRKLGNAFIVSLAIADLFVSCLVMTFALCNDLMNQWIFGDWFCDVWISFDIMCCTASILNLCAISLDRFIHIKDCLLYNQWMTRRVAISAVIIIWFISALVSFVPINLGWHKPPSDSSSSSSSSSSQLIIASGNSTTTSAAAVAAAAYQLSAKLAPLDETTGELDYNEENNVNLSSASQLAAAANNRRHDAQDQDNRTRNNKIVSGDLVDGSPQCMLSLTPTYAVISSTISFYIPCIIMLGLYTKLFACARKHVKNIQAISKAPAPLIVAHRPADAGQVANNDESVQEEQEQEEGDALTKRKKTRRRRRVRFCARAWLKFRPREHQQQQQQEEQNERKCGGETVAVENENGAQSNDKLFLRSPANQLTKVARGGCSGADSVSGNCAASEVAAGEHKTIGSSNARTESHLNQFKQQLTLDQAANSIIGHQFQQQQQQQHESRPFLAHHHHYEQQAGPKEASSILKRASDRQEQEQEQEQRQKEKEKKKPAEQEAEQSRPRREQLRATTSFTLASQQQRGQQLATHKAAVTLGIIMGTFLFCWVPFFCLNIIKAFCVDCIPSSLFRAFTWLGYANSALNPIIYGIHNSEFRNAFNRIFFKHLNIKNSRYYLNRRFSAAAAYDMRRQHNNNNNSNNNAVNLNININSSANNNHHNHRSAVSSHGANNHLGSSSTCNSFATTPRIQQQQRQQQQLNTIGEAAVSTSGPQSRASNGSGGGSSSSSKSDTVT